MNHIAFSGSRRAVAGAIGKALQEAAGREVAYSLDVDSRRGRLGVRVFADLPESVRVRAENEMRYWTPAHMLLDVSYEQPPFDLRALAEAIARGEPGAIEVFVDAVIELGVVSPETHGAAAAGHAIGWAEEVFPSVRTNA
jgi:hypothetical protein